jgi:hypothetical protein
VEELNILESNSWSHCFFTMFQRHPTKADAGDLGINSKCMSSGRSTNTCVNTGTFKQRWSVESDPLTRAQFDVVKSKITYNYVIRYVTLSAEEVLDVCSRL